MHLLLSLLLAQAAAAATQSAMDASKLELGAPATVTIVDTDKIKGEPWRLAWSPDGKQLALTAMKRGRNDAMDLTHYVVDAAGGEAKKVDAEPDWASEYWTWKSHRAAPGNPGFEIQLDQQKKNESATARPMGGDLARGGASSAPGASIDDVAGQMSTNLLVITLMLKGAVLGQWKGEPFVPGLTFGWAPAGMNGIAFAGQDGKLMVMDEAGRKQKVESTKDVRLPAWSADGARLAWVEKQDRKKFRIQTAAIK